MAAHFVNAINILNGAAWRIQSLHRFVAGSGNRFCNPLIDGIVRVKPDYFLSCGIKNDFPEWNAAELLIFVQQPRDELIHRCFRRW